MHSSTKRRMPWNMPTCFMMLLIHNSMISSFERRNRTIDEQWFHEPIFDVVIGSWINDNRSLIAFLGWNRKRCVLILISIGPLIGEEKITAVQPKKLIRHICCSFTISFSLHSCWAQGLLVIFVSVGPMNERKGNWGTTKMRIMSLLFLLSLPSAPTIKYQPKERAEGHNKNKRQL